ncbi:ABC transporter substrate-binding protein [uncultured Brachyspira sp.]|uniref:ABC transporter substrate-binding protein n=1 Tax=uncultured Brachyspira sp. TaxID=221953 RepID=UPI00262C3AA3|nr:ABC transporter substrate-binding protein [uncultured Brachyspira sp.]
MKKILLTITFILLFSFFISCSKKTNENTGKIRVAYHPNVGGASAIITGIHQNYFKDEGLDIELVKFTSGPSEIAAMVSGNIQIGYIGFGAHTLAAEGKVQIIATDGIAVVEGIRTLKTSGITTVEQLKGKTLITQLGTSGETIIDQVLVGTGVNKSDINILNAEVSSAVASFLANKVDAISVWPPYTVEIDNRIGLENLNIIKPQDVGVDSTASWIVTPDYLEANTDTVIKFTRALYKAMDYRKEHLDEAITNVSNLIGLDIATVSQEKYSSDWMDSKTMKSRINDGSISNIYRKQIDYFLQNNRLNSEPVSVDKYVRIDIIKQALN